MKPILVAILVASEIPADLAFNRWFTAHEHGVEVQIARAPGGPPWIKGVAEVAASVERVATVLTDYGRYAGIFGPVLRKARVLGTGTAKEVRLHLVWHYPFPLRNRDAVVRYAGSLEPGGAFVLSWESDPRPGDPREGARIERVAGETRVEPVGASRCRVVYTYLGDLGGKFPEEAQEKAWRTEPVEYIRSLRRALSLPDPP